MAKRLMDIVLAVALLVILAPVSLAIVVILYITTKVHALINGLPERQPIIFKQLRVGQYGCCFTIYKFITMRPYAGDHVAADNTDPRITRVGRFLRATALDEIPELINVLKGDMSIVGPRPAQVWEHEQCSQSIYGWRYRTDVKPGLIGLAQLRAPRCDYGSRLMYDMEYILRQSLWLDLKLIAMGIVYNLRGKWV